MTTESAFASALKKRTTSTTRPGSKLQDWLATLPLHPDLPEHPIGRVEVIEALRSSTPTNSLTDVMRQFGSDCSPPAVDAWRRYDKADPDDADALLTADDDA